MGNKTALPKTKLPTSPVNHLKLYSGLLALVWIVLIGCFLGCYLQKTDQGIQEAALILHGIILIIGLGGIFIGTSHLQRQYRAREEAEKTARINAECLEEICRLDSLKIMASAIAHRFNNAMFVVMGNLELLQANLADRTEEKQMAAKALDSARGAAEVGSMMLTYVGSSMPDLHKVNLAEVVRHTVTEMKNLPPTVSLKFHDAKEPLFCKMDRQQIKDVIHTILTNSIESLADSAGNISISLGRDIFQSDSLPVLFRENIPDSGSYIFCKIEDNGCGISRDDIKRVFEPFFTTKFIGRGLGLALAAGIINSHNGALTINSRVDKGTTVTILLPALAHNLDKE